MVDAVAIRVPRIRSGGENGSPDRFMTSILLGHSEKDIIVYGVRVKKPFGLVNVRDARTEEAPILLATPTCEEQWKFAEFIILRKGEKLSVTVGVLGPIEERDMEAALLGEPYFG